MTGNSFSKKQSAAEYTLSLHNARRKCRKKRAACCFATVGYTERKGRKLNTAVLFVLFLSIFMSPGKGLAVSLINNTKHDLSATSQADIRALTETRICVFCHTPHNASPDTPLWNRNIDEGTNYLLYSNPETMFAQYTDMPTGTTKLCLGCHDGVVSAMLGNVLRPQGGIAMSANRIPSTSHSFIGTDLRNDHPVSFSYDNSDPNPEILPQPQDLTFYGTNNMLHCTTCHNPHDDTYGKFLVMDMANSALCIKCHDIDGWSGSKHDISTSSVAGLLPFPETPPRTWPSWPTLGEWGCEACHMMHGAPSGPFLLNAATEAETCAPCHGSTPVPHHSPVNGSSSAAGADSGPINIMAQMKKFSSHDARQVTTITSRKMSRMSGTDVTCSDCHNAHAVKTTHAYRTVGVLSGALDKVTGVDRSGADLKAVFFEYEICFKCHADYDARIPHIQRVVNSVNTRLEFDPDNPSYHPVLDRGKGFRIPSLNPPSTDPSNPAPADLTSSSIILCTDCHGDDSGSKGPHGSNYPPILSKRYETEDNTRESSYNYALCYRCHNRMSILNDESFGKKLSGNSATRGGHSGHLKKGAPCSACHDAHGVAESGGLTGSHTHLINFDIRIVKPKPGNQFPIFDDTGTFSGSCTLVCHGRLHDNLSY